MTYATLFDVFDLYALFDLPGLFSKLEVTRRTSRLGGMRKMIKQPDYFVNDDDYRGPYLDVPSWTPWPDGTLRRPDGVS